MSMRIKQKLLRLLPAYRMGNTIRQENEIAQQELSTRLNQLDYKMEYLFWLSQQRDGESMAETKQRVFLSMPKAEGTSGLIQQMNHKILKRMKQVCDENGIPFYLVFGTQMGAVRNRGFIPWDDDVDVAMMRADAERLIRLLQTDPEIRADHCYSVMFEKFIKVKFRDSEKFFVDVFFMDEFQADEFNVEERYREILRAHWEYVGEMKRYFAETGARISDYTIPKPDAALDARMEAKYAELASGLEYYGKGNYISFSIDDSCLKTNTWYVYPKDELLKPVPVMFDGVEYNTFSNYDQFLRNIYGDYWKLPRNLLGGHTEFSELTSEDFRVMAAYGILMPEEAEQWIASSSKMQSFHFEF